MTDIKGRIEAELDAIERVLSLLPERDLAELSALEIAGVASLIHNYYNGIENILKQVFAHKSINVPGGHSWHQDLLRNAVKEGIISSALAENLKEYLAFRHFFIHSYSLDLQIPKLKPLIDNIHYTFDRFKSEIEMIGL